ncbi:MAG: sigma 54-interacting transcriptional regulator [Syntrophales bacterium]|nr:sigma 54-interacting transcriptional regulator [Syntrophales bacterium]
MDSKETIKLRGMVRFYEMVLDDMQNGVMITDPSGKVLFLSKTYGEFLGINPIDAIGRHCREVVENTRMDIVAQTGIAEINQAHRIKDQDMVVQRIPIKKNGEVIAVFGQVMFKDVRDLQNLARKLSILESKVELYEKELISIRSSKYTINNIVGRSEQIVQVKQMALRAALSNAPVLLMGESGTGKELFAHAIHHASERRPYPFIRLNCAAIPKDLLEAELFGYEPGAYTGASNKGKPGKFELANQGSIFLDEISDLPLEMQPKLLRVLEEKEMERIGGNRMSKSDFRLIAATHENLEHLVREGKFRKDLFFRLNVIPIAIPPLRERKDDIPLIVEHLLMNLSKDMGTHIVTIKPAVMEILQNKHWPGNVRELANVLERMLHTVDEDTIDINNLPIFMQNQAKEPVRNRGTLLKGMKEDLEREAMLHAMKAANNNKSEAARLLGIHRTALYKKIKKTQRQDIIAPK